MTDIATLKTRLAEAETQLHQIQLKGSVTQIAHSLGGQNAVQRAAVDPVKLQAYIQELKLQIARLEGGVGRMRQVTW